MKGDWVMIFYYLFFMIVYPSQVVPNDRLAKCVKYLLSLRKKSDVDENCFSDCLKNNILDSTRSMFDW